MSRTPRIDNNLPMVRQLPPSFFSLLLSAALLAISLVVGVSAQEVENQPLAVPAQFIHRLDLPGEMNELLRPGRIFVDDQFGEVLVSDPGHDRIVIFDQHGVFRFEFYGTELMGSAHDLVVDSKGYIYVVGTTVAGHLLFKFDFDGMVLDTIDLSGMVSGPRRVIGSIAIDDDDNLYLFAQSTREIVSITSDGQERYRFRVSEGLSDKDLREVVYGSMSIYGDRLFLPLSSFGNVEIYDLTGRLIRTFGIRGNMPGQFNFPVAVAVSSQGIMMVLDKHRFAVSCFGPDYRFLGEFGGKGQRDGWFYHPTTLAVDTSDQVYVGQIFNNLVQVLAIPDFIEAKVAAAADDVPSLANEQKADKNNGTQIPNVETASDGTPAVSMTP